MGLFEELTQSFPLEDVYPYGLVLVIPKEAFQNEWETQLKNEGVQVYTNSYNGRICFFLRKKDDVSRKQRRWTLQEETELLKLWKEGYGVSQIAEKLGRCRGSVIGKIQRLKENGKLQVVTNITKELGSNPSPQNNDLLKELIQSLNLLYEKGHVLSCKILLENANKFMEEESA
ncbi:MAG: GcrA family cell cycle regulator [Candidatus Bathyarchaeia archaeon]